MPLAELSGSVPLAGAATSSPKAVPVTPSVTDVSQESFPSVLPSGSDFCFSEASVRACSTFRVMALSFVQSSTNSAIVLYMSQSYHSRGSEINLGKERMRWRFGFSLSLISATIHPFTFSIEAEPRIAVKCHSVYSWRWGHSGHIRGWHPSLLY